MWGGHGPTILNPLRGLVRFLGGLVFRFHRGLIALLVAVGAALAIPAGAPALAAQPSATPQERATAIVRPSVVYLGIEWEGWVRDQRDGQLWDPDPLTDTVESIQLAFRCTGFVVSEDGFIVTAGHCVDPGVEGVASAFYEVIVQGYVDAGLLDASQFDSAVSEIAENSVVEGLAADDPVVRNVYVQYGVAVSGINVTEAFPARVIDVSPVSAGDVALLKVDESPLPAVELAEGEVPVGTEVLAIGYPGSADDISDSTLEPSSKDGTISNLRTDGGVPVYETSAAITGGMSGGPVVNLDGQVIGLVSRIPAAEPQAFNFAAASSLIAEMLAGNGVTNQLSETDLRYREGLDAYFGGHYSDAIESLDTVLARIPSHQQAQDYRQRAVEQRDAGAGVGEDNGGIPGWVIVAGIVVLGLLVVAGAVLALLLVHRGGRRKAPPPAGMAAPAPPGPPAPAAGPQSAPPPAFTPPSAAQPHAMTRPPMATPRPNGPAAVAPDAPAVATVPDGRSCGNCGAPLAVDARFCGQCGTSVT